MKILAVSDEIIRSLYSPNVVEQHGDAAMVIGCGDLPYYYLEYIVTMLTSPVFYVYGNHDKQQLMSDGRLVDRAEGCILLEETTATHAGVILAGLGGSMRYQPRAIHQYSEAEMWARIARLTPKLIMNRLRYGRFMDVFVAHSPAFGIHDGRDLPHRGFKSFLTLMRVFKPALMLHGHKHEYRRDIQRETTYHDTTVINVYPQRVINFEAPSP
jgi:Icc-related predicted phosphoesterase